MIMHVCMCAYVHMYVCRRQHHPASLLLLSNTNTQPLTFCVVQPQLCQHAQHKHWLWCRLRLVSQLAPQATSNSNQTQQLQLSRVLHTYIIQCYTFSCCKHYIERGERARELWDIIKKINEGTPGYLPFWPELPSISRVVESCGCLHITLFIYAIGRLLQLILCLQDRRAYYAVSSAVSSADQPKSIQMTLLEHQTFARFRDICNKSHYSLQDRICKLRFLPSQPLPGQGIASTATVASCR